MKPLIIYFTWDGRIEGLAREIARQTQGEMFQIRPVEPYPAEKLPLCARVSQELFDGIRPEYVEDEDTTDYETIFFGTPIWAHELPPVVSTFIERHDFKGKTVIPFCSCLTPLDATKLSEIFRACTGCTALEGYVLTDEPTDFDEWMEDTAGKLQ